MKEQIKLVMLALILSGCIWYPSVMTAQCDIPDVRIEYCGDSSIIDLIALETVTNGTYTYAEYGILITDPMMFIVNGSTVVDVLFVETGTNCSERFKIFIDSRALPTINFLNDPMLSCRATQDRIITEVVPAGDYEFTWSGPGLIDTFVQNPCVDQPGWYFVEVVDIKTNCSSLIDSVIVNIDVKIPNAGVVVLQNCDGTATLLATGFDTTRMYSFEWLGPSFLSDTDSFAVLINERGIYNFVISDTSNGCQLVTQVSVDSIKNDFNSTHLLNDVKKFNLYPNPSSRSIFIDTDVHIEDIALMDAKGHIVSAERIGTNEINIINLPIGVYFVGIIYGHKEIVWKKVLKH